MNPEKKPSSSKCHVLELCLSLMCLWMWPSLPPRWLCMIVFAFHFKCGPLLSAFSAFLREFSSLFKTSCHNIKIPLGFSKHLPGLLKYLQNTQSSLNLCYSTAKTLKTERSLFKSICSTLTSVVELFRTSKTMGILKAAYFFYLWCLARHRSSRSFIF